MRSRKKINYNGEEKKENIIVKIKKFFEKYFGLGIIDDNNDSIEYEITNDESDTLMVAEEGKKYKY